MSVALPKTPIGKDYEKVKEVIKTIAEPHIEKIIEKLNEELFSKFQIRVGASVEWFVERSE